MSKRRYSLGFALVGGLLALLVGLLGPLVAAQPTVTFPTFADPEFRETWERYDRPVFFGEVARSFTWGNQVSGAMQEPYAEGPGGQHLVQYFDKSRMEINDPNADRDNPFFVTNGLLALDMIRGQFQVGDEEFVPAPQGPAQIPFGDLDDATGPTYASFTDLLDDAPVPAGEPIVAALDRAGNVSNTADARGVVSRGVVFGAEATNHSIASVFLDFLELSGPVYENGQNVTQAVFFPTFFVTGLPISEAYWTRVEVGAETREVLLQCFERRCLTYAPSNPAGFRVELANTGLQYFQYRYNTAPPAPAPTTPTVSPPVATPAMTPTTPATTMPTVTTTPVTVVTETPETPNPPPVIPPSPTAAAR